jgi:hypothetical protein
MTLQFWSIPLPADEHQMEVDPSEHMKEVQEPVLEQIHTTGSLGNTLTWEEQQILEPIDQVTNIHGIAYDRKRKAIMRRTTKKRRLMMDSSILITLEEKLLNTKHVNTSELIGIGMAIIDAMLNRAKRDEKELDTTLKELDYLRHLEKYYQDSTQATVFMKSEFQDAYANFTSERHIFTTCVVDYQV